MAGKLKQFKDYFGFSRTEQNGMLVLFVLLMLVILTNIFLPLFFKSKPIDTTEFEELVRLYEQKQTMLKDSIQNRKTFQSNQFHETSELKPFPFDPNNLPVEQWKEMGLTNQQIKVIKNFESKGGKFYKPEDLEKIYSISHEDYLALKPYIRINVDDDTEIAEKPALTPFIFDPNVVTEKELMQMGFPEVLVRTIDNFRINGGKFYKKEDFKKIYGITDDLYAQLEEFINIIEDSVNLSKETLTKFDFTIELNTADSLDLQQLSGIGPSFASRMIKYRDMLGGYARPEQLLEVYGMDSARYAGFISHITISKGYIKKIDINKATIKELIKHPYIEFYLAKSIIAHREKIGKFTTLHELKDAALIYDELFLKIEPYLTVDENIL